MGITTNTHEGLKNTTGDLNIINNASDGDVLIKGSDAGSTITALTLDMSDSGKAYFNHEVVIGSLLKIPSLIYHVGDLNTYFGFTAADTFKIATGGTVALTVDSSQNTTFAGTGEFEGNVTINTPSASSSSQGLTINRPAAGTHYASVEFATNGTVDWSVGTNSTDAFEVYENGQAATTRFSIAEGGNATFAGTISSGAITSTSHIESAQHFKATGNNLSLHAGGNQILNIDLNKNIYPVADGDTDLGFSSTAYRFRSGYFTGELQSGSLDINGNADILGSLAIHNAITINKSQGASALTINHAGNGGWTQYASTNDGVYGYIGSGAHLLGTVVNDNDFVLRAEEEFAVSIGATEKMRINASGGATFAATVAATTFSGDLNGTINTATTAATQSAGNNSTKVATTAYADAAVAALVDSAPANLNTLNELAEALNDDDDAIVTINTALGTKLPLAGGIMSGAVKFSSTTYGAFDSENFFRIKLQDVGGVMNDVGIGQTASNNLGFNTTAGGTFTFNDGTNGNVLTISDGQATFDGEVEAASLDINGNANISGITEIGGQTHIATTHTDAYTPTAYNDKSQLTIKSPNADTNYSSIRFTNAAGNYEMFIGAVQVGSNIADIVFQGYDRAGGGYKEYIRINDDGNTTFAGTVQVGVDDTGHDVIFYGATSGRYLHWDESEDALRFRDNTALKIGSGSDLQIKHDGSNSYISQNDGGNLYIQQNVNDADIVFQSDNGSGGVATYFSLDGGVGHSIASKAIRFNDSVEAFFGSSDDLKIIHNGSHSYVSHVGTGDLYLQNTTNDGNIILRSDNGSGGVTPYITLDGGDVSTTVDTIKVLMPNLPTSDPGVAGQLYHIEGDLKISLG